MSSRSPIFRVLCLDGGGMRGVFGAAFIAAIEEVLGDPLASYLDLIVGTSTGGLIALGLASGRSGQEMLDLYRNHGREIFSGSWPGRKLLMPKYSRKGLDRLLRHEFGDLRMRDLNVATCVSAYEAVSGQTRVFKTAHADDLYWGGDQLVWKVAAATSAAPTYFAPVQFTEEDAHVDGGVWANNPSMVAITEAVRRFSHQLGEIRLLSVGTAAPRATVKSYRTARWMGLPRWARPGLALLQGGPALGNHFQALHLLGADHYLRVDDTAQGSAPVALDSVAACQPLAALGHRVALDRWPSVRGLLELGPAQNGRIDS
jgi:patatin-like phospholipase/acyl hydrolase